MPIPRPPPQTPLANNRKICIGVFHMKKSAKTALAYRIYQDAECIWQMLRRNEYEYEDDMIQQTEESVSRYIVRARKLLAELLIELEERG